jgi:hypothetical protein
MDDVAFREAVISLMTDAFGAVTLALSIIVLLVATAVVRHW